MNSAHIDPTPGHENRDIHADSMNVGRSSDAITDEFRNFFGDVQELMRQVAHDADPALIQLRAKVETAMASVKATLASSQEQIGRQARSALQGSDRYVRAQPWQAVGIAALVGVVLGVVVARR